MWLQKVTALTDIINETNNISLIPNQINACIHIVSQKTKIPKDKIVDILNDNTHSFLMSPKDDLFSHLPYEMMRHIAMELSMGNINKLCRSSERFTKLCQDEEFWRMKHIYDFGDLNKKRVGGWKQTYAYYGSMLAMLSKYYSVITKNAFDLIINRCGEGSLNFVKEKIESQIDFLSRNGLKIYFDKILSMHSLTYILRSMPGKTKWIDGGDTRPSFEEFIPKALIEKYPDYEDLQYDFLANYELPREKKQLCAYYEEVISHPSIVYINGRPRTINYDYDLAQYLHFFLANAFPDAKPRYNDRRISDKIMCDRFEDIENEILSLAKK